MTSPDFVLRSRRVLTPDGLRSAWIAVRGGRIASIGLAGTAAPDLLVEDVGDAVVFPGLVDTHVHVNDPGRAHWEGFETATAAAAAGGVTAIVDMPLN
jgi:allantoinase